MISGTLGKIFKTTKQLVTLCDLFCTIQLLRYKQNPQFKSANGGMCSIAIIIAFTVIFTQTIVSTFEKSNISSQRTLMEQTDPSYFSTKESPFLFAIGVSGFDLSDKTTKYFNIQLSQKSKQNGVSHTQYYNLAPCNRSAWTNFDESLGQSFDKIGLRTWLCLPEATSLQFSGKFTSQIFKYIKIALKPCVINAGENRTCVDQKIIDDYLNISGPISFNYYFVNNVINSDNQQYLGFYLQDRNYFKFTKHIGTSANLFISSYTIDTDQSLWPWVQSKMDVGGIVYEATQTFIFTPSNNVSATEYINLFLRKSSLSLNINRSFRKYDDTLSYIGGLFSTFMVTLFVMTKYNEYGYQIEIASKIYTYKKKAAIQSNKFNLLAFFAYCFYCTLDFFKIGPEWKTMNHFDVVRQQIGKQLDLQLLIRKISFLQDCIRYLFQDYQLQCLHLKGKMTLEQASKIRKKFSSRKRLFKLKKKYQQQRKNESQQFDVQVKQQIFQLGKRQVADLPQQSIRPNEKQNNKIANNQVLSLSKIQTTHKNSIKQEDSDFSSQQQEQIEQKKLLADYIASINQLKMQAKNGNIRCKRIYKNLDKNIKELPDIITLLEINETNVFLNQRQEKINQSLIVSKRMNQQLHKQEQ